MSSAFPVFDPVSPQAAAIRDLFVQVLLISAAIFVIVAGLICLALWRFRARETLPEQDFGSHRKEIWWLAGPVIIVLWIAAISAKLVLTLNAAPPQYAAPSLIQSDTDHDSKVDLIVTGHQWWWEVEYPGTDIVSANEIHIPTNKKLRVKLQSVDVIHSFWVAQLARKMDAIPGHENYIWLEASEPGVFQGRCAEYCGTQHAWMTLQVIAHTPQEYEQWATREADIPQPPTDAMEQQGKALFMRLTCSQCHRVSGTAANGDYAPDLTHVASRKTLGAGVVENSSEKLRLWLEDPQSLKPGCKMPNFKLSEQQLDHLVAYLGTLK